MLYFENDYCEGAHSSILQKLSDTNGKKLPGYGTDPYSASAREKIRAACGCPNADVFFLAGGTQTNTIVISSLLKRWEGVVAASTGHIAAHEAGAVEYTGHKILTLPQKEGKLSARDLEAFLTGFYSDQNREHMVFPGMVYLSHPTEYGTLYSKKELADISCICQRYDIPLFLDGARLGYALAVPESNLTLEEIARLTTVFYIGGTKMGALLGEAVVFPRKAPPHFMTMVKQQGALLAKGRILGIQFDCLFTDDLYLKIGKNAIQTAAVLKNGFRKKGYSFFLDSPTNQIFIILENKKLEELRQHVIFSFWETLDETHTVVRFATSWATRLEEIEELIRLL